MRPVDIENQIQGKELGASEANEPLLPSADRLAGASQYPGRSREVIELDDVPPIIKSGNGNIFWSDEQCTRRVGLTATEARLFLKLLQVDSLEGEYDDYKDMFDDFGKEHERLQELVSDSPWWSLGAHHQRAMWKARIQWLERMEEPRLWLLFLMARRKRILKQATVRVLERFREKGAIKRAASFHNPREEPSTDGASLQDQSLRPVMINDASQTSEVLLERMPSLQQKSGQPEMISDASQTSEVQLERMSSLQQNSGQPETISDAAQMSEMNIKGKSHKVTVVPRASISIGQRSSHSHPASSCPAFNKEFEATRQDIKRQVELLMPKQSPYIVIGVFLRTACDPKERILQFDRPENLFKILRHGESEMRGWRRLLSMKGLRGFGLYKCEISRGAHIPLTLTTSQEVVLSQFYLAYKASLRHSDEAVATAWEGWVHKNLNGSKSNPLEGRYSLQLMYEWSSYRLITIVSIPLLLSFVLGLSYMVSTGDVSTAWTISSYIVTAAAAIIALMAIIGSLKDI